MVPCLLAVAGKVPSSRREEKWFFSKTKRGKRTGAVWRWCLTCSLHRDYSIPQHSTVDYNCDIHHCIFSLLGRGPRSNNTRQPLRSHRGTRYLTRYRIYPTSPSWRSLYQPIDLVSIVQTYRSCARHNGNEKTLGKLLWFLLLLLQNRQRSTQIALFGYRHSSSCERTWSQTSNTRSEIRQVHGDVWGSSSCTNTSLEQKRNSRQRYRVCVCSGWQSFVGLQSIWWPTGL